MTHYAPGTPVLLREVHQGKVWMLRPVTVVHDGDDFIALYMRHGVLWRGAMSLAFGRLRVPWEPWQLSPPIPWQNQALRIYLPGETYSVSAMWTPDWDFYGWYVNVEEALRRTEFGFDYMDWTLDIEASPDLTEWHVKDEDELEEAVQRGVYTAEHAAEIHEAAKLGLDDLLSRRPPFDRDWDDWRPDPAWPIAVLPERWE